MDNVRAAVVGCGAVSNDHVKAWRKVKYAEVVAVLDLNESLARKTAAEWGVPNYYTSLSDMLEKEKVDVVDICTPPHTHASLAVQAMEAGKAVLIEKPMAITVSDAKEIVDCQKKTGVKAGVIHNWLFDPPVLETRAIVEKGLLGEIISIEVEALNTKEDAMAANQNHWCHKLPGGRFSEMLAHPIYLTSHFLGNEIEVCDVYACKLNGYPWMKFDELHVLFRVEKKLGRTYASFNSPRDAIYLGLYGTEGIIRLELINSILNILPRRATQRFSKALDSIRQAGQIVKWTLNDALKVALKRWMSGHDMCIKLFAESVVKDCEPPISVSEGLSVVRVLEDICRKIENVDRVNG